MPQAPFFIASGVAVAAWIILMVSVWSYNQTGSVGQARLIKALMDFVLYCHETRMLPLEERLQRLRSADVMYQRVEKQLLRIHRSRGVMPAHSLRRSDCRRHEAHVAGAMRKDLIHIDVDSGLALERLSHKAVCIMLRYSEGRVGQLLPEGDLAGVTPLSLINTALRESMRMVLALLGGLAGCAAIYTLGPAVGASDGAITFLAPFGFIMGATCLGGWRRASEVREIFPSS
ncbi:hypothetical protein ACIGZH_35600 [Streptomyces sp. NPDC058319]|uniref:hypothetical protein n=1 Tax=unclassified Streptomyces TaxID=2593676 RepID=UPI0036EAF3C8